MTCQVTGTSHEINQSLDATPLNWWLWSRILSHPQVLQGTIQRTLLAGSPVTSDNHLWIPNVSSLYNLRPEQVTEASFGGTSLHVPLCDQIFLIIGGKRKQSKSREERHQQPSLLFSSGICINPTHLSRKALSSTAMIPSNS